MGFGKDGKGAIIKEFSSLALGTLASNTGLLMGALALQEDYRILKTRILSSLFNHTSGETALSLWHVNGELSLAEIEEAIESSGPVDRNDRIGVERSERYVRMVGAYVPNAQGTTAHLQGKGMIEFNPRWTFSDPEGWDWVVFNHDINGLTTGTVVILEATHFGVWLT